MSGRGGDRRSQAFKNRQRAKGLKNQPASRKNKNQKRFLGKYTAKEKRKVDANQELRLKKLEKKVNGNSILYNLMYPVGRDYYHGCPIFDENTSHMIWYPNASYIADRILFPIVRPKYISSDQEELIEPLGSNSFTLTKFPIISHKLCIKYVHSPGDVDDTGTLNDNYDMEYIRHLSTGFLCRTYIVSILEEDPKDVEEVFNLLPGPGETWKNAHNKLEIAQATGDEADEDMDDAKAEDKILPIKSMKYKVFYDKTRRIKPIKYRSIFKNYDNIESSAQSTDHVYDGSAVQSVMGYTGTNQFQKSALYEQFMYFNINTTVKNLKLNKVLEYSGDYSMDNKEPDNLRLYIVNKVQNHLVLTALLGEDNVNKTGDTEYMNTSMISKTAFSEYNVFLNV